MHTEKHELYFNESSHEKIRYDVTKSNAGSNTLNILPANHTRVVMAENILSFVEIAHLLPDMFI